MAETVLFDNGQHRNILLEDYGHGQAVQANQHLIVQGREAMILDPGGHTKCSPRRWRTRTC